MHFASRDNLGGPPEAGNVVIGIEEGDIVEIEVEEEGAVLMPKKLIDKSQAYFWTRRWQKGEREADEDIKARRVKTFDSVDELIKDLDHK
jgi:bifunctional DNA-binding transcriptional regulator/antitoxin component of YhaV-PrlF toxin-antitoxin module